MDWNGEIKRKPRTLKGADSPTALIFDLMNKVIANKRPNKSYKPQVRFSKLPICSLLFAQEVVKGSNDVPFSMDWFTEIGTGIHDVFQIHFPLTEGVSQYVYGDWKCVCCLDTNNKPLITASHCCTPLDLRCPRCETKNSLRYSEIEVNYKGVKGHIDLLLLIDKKFYLLDWKSCSQAIVENPSNLPYPKNSMQIESYCEALRYEFDIDVYWHCLIYVSRDSTDLDDTFSSTKKRHHFCGQLVNPKMLRIRHNQLETAVKTKRLVKRYLNDPTKSNLKLLNDHRPCKSVEDYENPATGMKHGFVRRGCRYLDDCAGCGSLNKLTRAARDLHEMVE